MSKRKSPTVSKKWPGKFFNEYNSPKGLTPILPGAHQRHIFPLGILHN